MKCPWCEESIVAYVIQNNAYNKEFNCPTCKTRLYLKDEELAYDIWVVE